MAQEIKTATRSMRNVQSWPFLSTQFPLPHRTNARLVSQIPKLSTLACQTVEFEVIAHNPTTRTVPTNPKPTSRRYTTNPQTLRFSSHTSLFRTLPVQLSRFHHVHVPTHAEPTSQRYTTNPSVSDFATTAFHIAPGKCPVSNFAGTALHVTPCMCATQPILNQRPEDTLQILRP